MSASDKTEEPTAKKLEDARKKGQVPVSQEISVALSLLGLFALLQGAGPWLMSGYKDLLTSGLRGATTTSGDLTASSVSTLMMNGAQAALMLILPFALLSLAIGLLTGAGQTRLNFAPEALTPKWAKVDPIQGLKRLFGARGVFNTIKEMIKLTLIGTVTFFVLWPKRYEIATITGADPSAVLAYLGSLATTLGFAVAGSYVAIAIADILFQRYQFMRDQRMTKDEVKREQRNQDVNPEIKQMIKQRQMEASRKRMMNDVPTADVVITNPTHFAVALKYDPEKDVAPKVVAKGQDQIALKIREIASEHGVMLRENKPLARGLYKTCEVGQFIPGEMFVAVAHVLAHVYQEDAKQHP